MELKKDAVEFLKSVPVAPRKQINDNGRTYYYREWGEGLPIMCLPGWPVSSLFYAPLAKAAVDSGIKIISVDYPGWCGVLLEGQSFTEVDQYADFVERFIEASDLSNKQYVLLGYSYGGVISQKLIARGNIHPKAHILMSTFSSGVNFKNSRTFMPLIRLYDSLRMARIPLSDSFVIGVVRNYFEKILLRGHELDEVRESAIYTELRDEVLQSDVQTLISAGRSLLNEDLLSGIRDVPESIVIMGDKDLDFIVQDSPEIARMHNAKLSVLTGADHFHLYFRPLPAWKEIKDFISTKM